jgi:O-antigen/teichoic acid export membrane protein
VQLVFTGSLGVLCVAAAGLVYAIGLGGATMILALAPALVAWQLQEFGRRLLYTERRLVAALANDVLSYGGQAVALLVLWKLDLLTGTRALLTLAGAFTVGAVVLALQLRPSRSGTPDALSLAASWRFGKWLGLAELGQWFSTQFFIYLAAAILGSVASGAIKAGQTLLGPIAAFLAFFTSYLPIVFAKELERSGRLTEKLRWSFAAILPVVVVYCGVIAFFAKPLLEFVYGADYRRYDEVVYLFAIFYVALAFSTVAVAVLSSKGMTREVFVGQLAGATLAIVFGWLLLDALGPEGGVAGMLLSWAAAMALFVRALRLPLVRTALP